MADLLFNEGDSFVLNGQKLQCTFVSWRDTDEGKEKITYSFRDHDEVEQERKDADLQSVSNPIKVKAEELK